MEGNKPFPSHPLNDNPPDLQSLSPFFTRLPSEVRQLIYREVWRTTSTRQHIGTDRIAHVSHPDNILSTETFWHHVPCRTDPTAPDTRFEEFSQASQGSVAEAVWATRLKSEWCLHWACEESQIWWLANPPGRRLLRLAEQHNGDLPPGMGFPGEIWGSAPKTPFKDVLKVCKRMYLESLPTLYSSITWVFTDLSDCHDFLSLYSSSPDRFPIRSIELTIRTTQLLTELYYPSSSSDGPNPTFGTQGQGGGSSHPGISMENNPWSRVCDSLSQLKNLHSLRIWFDTRDLRGWHTRVSETRFFAKLFNVKGVKNKKNFILALPQVPHFGPGGSLNEAEHHLAGEILEAAPFTVERGPRPDNWRVHLMTSGLRGT
ncbi:hypothetical protein QBC35DRAFT_382906 [Podospora australis]|uniref:DUF7730 domain-containing protein n=1 Tax=Podospora australis TaxID=1536484 RepID=A0AAN6WUK7_9PEZI|nr:hypothetical protein QBC35DRAFT_382906 [Podospora australis]